MAWTVVRGNRYHVLEEEFFRLVLGPHEDALIRAYGIGANEVASGIQSVAQAMHSGFEWAVEGIDRYAEHVRHLSIKWGMPADQAIERIKVESPEILFAAENMYRDLLGGGLCNLSRQTKLPRAILEDLSFSRGENTEFFEPGPFCGTLLRTLPARIKPLVQLDDGFYATDPQFVRDAAYRAIQRGLTARLPDYREEWNRKQRVLTEASFPKIFKNQLAGASVYSGIWYRDPANGNWVENDTLIVVDDVLIQIESKAGIGVMHSPATNFSSHVRAIQNLIIDAHLQTKRFFEYMNSAPVVPLYNLSGGQYVEIASVRLKDFRLMLPIGLTVESFSPFSTMCKALPTVPPLLGRYPFLSMSIDDLLVLDRLLPTAGMLFHYLEVRQQVAGIRNAELFDEMDHLGAYLDKNRFDITLREQLAAGHDHIAWDGFSAEIDNYFATDRWLHEPPPSQSYPDKIRRLLELLARTRSSGWLMADAWIRNQSSRARTMLASLLRRVVPSLRDRDYRWFVLGGESALLVWVHRSGIPIEREILIRKAEVAALAMKTGQTLVLQLSVTPTGDFASARGISVPKPEPTRPDYSELTTEAGAMKNQLLSAALMERPEPRRGTGKKKPRPNEPCWCGSHQKFKKCHGARLGRK